MEVVAGIIDQWGSKSNAKWHASNFRELDSMLLGKKG
jgi:hypothetical protein